jgi:hypothetical protein
VTEPGAPSSLLVLWTTGDRITALDMALMYGLNAKVKDWWDEVTVLIWGASQTLAVEDPEVRDKVAELGYAGVRVVACRKCAENLGLQDQLTEMGCEVFYVGEFLTDWLKSGRTILTV